MTRIHPVASLLLASLLLCACGTEPPAAGDPERPTFADLDDTAEVHEGLFTFRRHADTGALYMDVRAEQLGDEFLWFGIFRDGPAASGSSRGQHRNARVLRLHRRYGKVEVQALDTSQWFDPQSPMARVADANLPPSVLAVLEILDEDDDGRLLLAADPVFLTEALQQLKPTPDPQAEPGSQFTLGELSAEKTALHAVHSYPENVLLDVNYVYEDPAPLADPGPAAPDRRAVSVAFQHHLVAMPDDGYVPRLADSRVGLFQERVDDRTDLGVTPWRDLVNRWHLVKEDPGAALSEPVEPITFWIGNATPHEYRQVIADAVLAWNQAFEQAGFRNAIAVKVQPDDAEWDAGDIRYHVIRWTSSDDSPWSGYGPSTSNPRTGQIFSADIMLELGFMSTALRDQEVFLDGRSDARTGDPRHCALGRMRANDLALAQTLAAVRGDPDLETVHLQQSLADLVLHEVGHTLGLSHNFIASTLQAPSDLYAVPDTASHELNASVMDYTVGNFAPPGVVQGAFYMAAPGRYDRWAIEYAYSEALDDPAAEQARLDAIAARSSQPGLALVHDAGHLTASDGGVDPRAQLWDMSADPVAHAADRLALFEEASAGLLQRYAEPGASWQAVYVANRRLMVHARLQGQIASRWIGGVYVDHSRQGQSAAGLPLVPVEEPRQRAAMALLRDAVFAPDAFDHNAHLYRHLHRQRRGWDGWDQRADPQVHAEVLDAQGRVLEHLLHPLTQQRIIDSALYGNSYSLDAVMTDLTAAIFSADLFSGGAGRTVNSRRQQLQHEYVARLAKMADEEAGAEWNHLSRGQAIFRLKQIDGVLEGLRPVDGSTRAHVVALRHRIERALED